MGKRIYREAGSSLEAHDDATQELVRLRKETSRVMALIKNGPSLKPGYQLCLDP
jgi:hypothetical protein